MNTISSNFICVMGVDGSGKTTIINKVIKNENLKLIPIKYVWFRFYHFFSYFILLYCRITGLTKYENRNGIRFGWHEFYKSPIITIIYPWVLFIDMIPMYFVKILFPRFRGYVIVCDRFIFDTLIDLMIDLNDPNIYKKLIGRAFIHLTPKNGIFILIDVDPIIIKKRRNDLSIDNFLEIRRNLYLQLAKEFGFIILENDKTIDELERKILCIISK